MFRPVPELIFAIGDNLTSVARDACVSFHDLISRAGQLPGSSASKLMPPQHVCQGFVSLLFLSQGSIEQFDRLIEPQFLRPCLQRAVAGDFVMLNRLRGREQPSIQSRRSSIFFHYLLPFLDDPDDVASFAARRLVQLSKHFVEASDVFLRLALMLLKGGL
jgi:hypothetical protein